MQRSSEQAIEISNKVTVEEIRESLTNFHRLIRIAAYPLSSEMIDLILDRLIKNPMTSISLEFSKPNQASSFQTQLSIFQKIVEGKNISDAEFNDPIFQESTQTKNFQILNMYLNLDLETEEDDIVSEPSGKRRKLSESHFKINETRNQVYSLLLMNVLGLESIREVTILPLLSLLTRQQKQGIQAFTKQFMIKKNKLNQAKQYSQSKQSILPSSSPMNHESMIPAIARSAAATTNLPTVSLPPFSVISAFASGPDFGLSMQTKLPPLQYDFSERQEDVSLNGYALPPPTRVNTTNMPQSQSHVGGTLQSQVQTNSSSLPSMLASPFSMPFSGASTEAWSHPVSWNASSPSVIPVPTELPNGKNKVVWATDLPLVKQPNGRFLNPYFEPPSVQTGQDANKKPARKRQSVRQQMLTSIKEFEIMPGKCKVNFFLDENEKSMNYFKMSKSMHDLWNNNPDVQSEIEQPSKQGNRSYLIFKKKIENPEQIPRWLESRCVKLNSGINIKEFFKLKYIDWEKSRYSNRTVIIFLLRGAPFTHLQVNGFFKRIANKSAMEQLIEKVHCNTWDIKIEFKQAYASLEQTLEMLGKPFMGDDYQIKNRLPLFTSSMFASAISPVTKTSAASASFSSSTTTTTTTTAGASFPSALASQQTQTRMADELFNLIQMKDRMLQNEMDAFFEKTHIDMEKSRLGENGKVVLYLFNVKYLTPGKLVQFIGEKKSFFSALISIESLRFNNVGIEMQFLIQPIDLEQAIGMFTRVWRLSCMGNGRNKSPALVSPLTQAKSISKLPNGNIPNPSMSLTSASTISPLTVSVATASASSSSSRTTTSTTSNHLLNFSEEDLTESQIPVGDALTLNAAQGSPFIPGLPQMEEDDEIEEEIEEEKSQEAVAPAISAPVVNRKKYSFFDRGAPQLNAVDARHSNTVNQKEAGQNETNQNQFGNN